MLLCSRSDSSRRLQRRDRASIRQRRQPPFREQDLREFLTNIAGRRQRRVLSARPELRRPHDSRFNDDGDGTRGDADVQGWRALPVARHSGCETNADHRSGHVCGHAQRGIPIIFFFPGLHPDLHQVSDGVEKIDFPKTGARHLAGARDRTARGQPRSRGPRETTRTPRREGILGQAEVATAALAGLGRLHHIAAGRRPVSGVPHTLSSCRDSSRTPPFRTRGESPNPRK